VRRNSAALPGAGKAADSPAAGAWDGVAGTPNGDLSWTILLLEKDGSLTGKISGEPGERRGTATGKVGEPAAQ
jgi:hypothetical protein